MVKIIEQFEKAQAKRLIEGKGNGIDKATDKWAAKFVEKHPKISTFIATHKNAIDVAFDIVLTFEVAMIGYNIGKISLARDLCADVPAEAAIDLTCEGRAVMITAKSITPKGLPRTYKIETNEKPLLMDIANKAIEALHNNGVEFHTI